jgi:hypothetical protein
MIHIKNTRSTEIKAVRKTDFLRYVPVAIFSAVMSLTSCVKDELFNTPHPDHGKVTVTADWSARGEDIAVPDKWTVIIGDYAGEETAETHAPDYLFTPGEYNIIAYNPAEKITVSGTTASVTSCNGRSGFISGTPGILFTHVQNITIKKDKEHVFTAAMRQQTGSFTLMIEPTGDAADRIESIEGILSGVAGTMDFANGTYGAPSDVALHFTKIAEGEHAGKWTATVWLLGIAGDVQKLTGTITFKDGNPQSMSLESDLTASLKDFNTDKTEPLTLGSTLVETPAEAGFKATITDWNTVTGNPVEAM